MALTWILIADAATARLYEVGKPRGGWRLIEELHNPEGRAKGRDFLVEPWGGLQKEEGAVFRGAMQPLSIKKVETRRFAHSLAGILEKGLDDHRYEHLVLVAAPEFLGMLRQELADPVEKRLAETIPKDYSHWDVRELERRVPIAHL